MTNLLDQWRSAPPAIGDSLPTWELPPVGREAIREFVTITGDRNAVHVDEEFAAAAGFPSVIASGPMTIALVGRYLERLVGPTAVRRLAVQLRHPVFPGDRLVCSGEITGLENGIATCDVRALREDGTTACKGTASFVHDTRGAAI